MYNNNSSYDLNATLATDLPKITLPPENIFIIIFASVVAITTVFGNTLVVLAVLTERRLRKVSNSFIVNLAVSDLLVGLIVTPMATLNHISTSWTYGTVMCDFLVSMDVICCTASICNLCAISIDRYRAITQPLKYALKRTPQRAAIMICIVWFVAAAVALPPLFGWREDRPKEISECLISQDESYTIYSTLGAFYIPLCIMVGVYIKIFQAILNRRKKFMDGNEISTTQVNVSSTSENKKYCVLSGDQLYPLRKLRKDSADNKKKIETVHPEVGYRLSRQQKYAIFECEDDIDSDDDMTVIQLPETVLTGRNEPISTMSAIQLHRTLTMSEPDLIEIAARNAKLNTFKPKISGGYPKSALKKTKKSAFRGRGSIYDKHVSFAKRWSFRLKTSRTCSVSGNVACNGNMNVKIRRKSLQMLDDSVSERSSSSRTTRISVTQEKKAAKTLGIIMGTFILCWMPFFIMALALPFCKQHCATFPFVIMEIFTWLGYANSALNPLIYTFFNMEFRRAFKRILCCKCQSYSKY
ncbi:5-hydroxytryptamine receptor 1A-like [Glandiceps talaboti]